MKKQNTNRVPRGTERIWATETPEFTKIGGLYVKTEKLDYYGIMQNTHPTDNTFTQKVVVIAVAGREPIEFSIKQSETLEDFI
jgi:hypothetical protein